MRVKTEDHRTLTLWAADCVERVLSCFEQQHPLDDRPRNAIAAGRAWARGEIRVGDARAAAFAAHAAARCAATAAARAAARAAAHAAATAHVAGHSRHAAAYAAVAVAHAGDPFGIAGAADAAHRERDWQYRRLAKHLRPLAFPSRHSRVAGDGAV